MKLISDYEAQMAIDNFINNPTDYSECQESEQETSSDGK